MVIDIKITSVSPHLDDCHVSVLNNWMGGEAF